MTDVIYLNRRDLIAHICRGDVDAALFLDAMVDVLHFWDDLVDRDHVLRASDINLRMWQAMVLLPRNAFYRAHFADLNPVLAGAIQNWMAANRIEADGRPEEMPVSFIIRSSYIDLFVQVALLVGGYEWAQEVSVAVRRNCHRETLAGYLRNLAKQSSDALALKDV